MTEQTPRVICIGEAVIELRRGPDGAFSAACAGDSFNTAVYLARAGLNVGFATAVGASLLRFSAVQRLAIAAIVIALLWAALWWAIR